MFGSPDTLIPDPYNPLDWNRYQYARGNPVNYNDPSGHMPTNGCNYEGCSATEGEEYRDYLYNVIYGGVDRKANSDRVESVLVGTTDVALSFVSPPLALLYKGVTGRNANGFEIAAAGLGFLPTGWISEGDGMVQIGKWVKNNPNMSAASRAYQEFVTEATPGWEFLRNGVNFDGAKLSSSVEVVLTDAKWAESGLNSMYARVNDVPIFGSKVLAEATRQMNAARGLAVEWHVSDQAVTNILSDFFNANGINISVIFTPFK